MTAEESIKELVEIYGLNSTFQDEIKEIMIKFAQYHVDKALEQASKDIDQERLEWYDYYDFSKGVETVSNTSDIEAILEAYPKENIK